MSLLIKGLKMPKRMPIKALIFPDGRVTVTLHSGKILECNADSILPHGRLGDLDTLIKELDDLLAKYPPNSVAAGFLAIFASRVELMPTIIPAEEGEQ